MVNIATFFQSATMALPNHDRRLSPSDLLSESVHNDEGNL